MDLENTRKFYRNASNKNIIQTDVCCLKNKMNNVNDIITNRFEYHASFRRRDCSH